MVSNDNGDERDVMHSSSLLLVLVSLYIVVVSVLFYQRSN